MPPRPRLHLVPALLLALLGVATTVGVALVASAQVPPAPPAAHGLAVGAPTPTPGK